MHNTLDFYSPPPPSPTDLHLSLLSLSLSLSHTQKQTYTHTHTLARTRENGFGYLKYHGEELLLEEMSEILNKIWEWRRSMNVYNCCWSVKVYNCCHFPCMSISRACSLAAFDTEEDRHASGSRSLWTWHLAVERGWWKLDRLFSRTQRCHREKLQEKVRWLMRHYKEWDEVRDSCRY